MKKSLYSKLMLIMLVVIVSLMAVVGAFLMRGVRTFYLSQFYQQMQSVFSSTDIAADLRSAADGDNGGARGLGPAKDLRELGDGARREHLLRRPAHGASSWCSTAAPPGLAPAPRRARARRSIASSPQLRLLGKTLPGLRSSRGLKAWCSPAMAARSAAE